jgi:hypothetical protein
MPEALILTKKHRTNGNTVTGFAVAAKLWTNLGMIYCFAKVLVKILKKLHTVGFLQLQLN